MGVFVVTLILLSSGLEQHRTIYECDVNLEAGISWIHLEGSKPSTHSNDKPDKHFALAITSPKPFLECDEDCRKQIKIKETQSLKPRNVVAEYCTDEGHQVLMETFTVRQATSYSLDLIQEKDSGFLVVRGPFDGSSALYFTHSGFAYPGCEDTTLYTHSGQCFLREDN